MKSIPHLGLKSSLYSSFVRWISSIRLRNFVGNTYELHPWMAEIYGMKIHPKFITLNSAIMLRIHILAFNGWNPYILGSQWYLSSDFGLLGTPLPPRSLPWNSVLVPPCLEVRTPTIWRHNFLQVEASLLSSSDSCSESDRTPSPAQYLTVYSNSLSIIFINPTLINLATSAAHSARAPEVSLNVN